MTQSTIAQQIHRALTILYAPNQVVELRVPKVDGKKQRTDSGYFNNLDMLARAAAKYEGRAAGVYVTLNPVEPALLARAANRVQEYAELSTSDDYIASRRWLPIDCDPKMNGKKRPAGISSTEEEHEAALGKLAVIQDWLTDSGWPEPISADSGNGGALLYAVELPNDVESKALVEQCLKALAAQFDDDTIDVDTTVHNAARIWKVYGTMAGKGDSTADRPHRRAQLLHVPSEIKTVSAALLRTLAKRGQQPETKSAFTSGIDAKLWLEKHQIGISSEKPNNDGGTIYLLDACPFNENHGGSATVIQLKSGALAFRCLHDSCRQYKWQDLRAKFEPDAYAQRVVVEPTHKPKTPIDHAFVLQCLERSEAGDAEMIEKLFEGVMGYDVSAKAWYAFSGHAWTRRDDVPRRMVWHSVASYYHDAAAWVLKNAGDDDSAVKKTVGALSERARQLRNLSRINNVLTLAQELLPIDSSKWDADPWLLGVPNGVLDLRTGQLRAGKPEDYIRTVAPTEWRGLDEPAPRWERFVSEVLSDEQDRAAFLQRLLGYALNGSTKEHVLSFFVGAHGRNGKRVLFEALQHTLGDYAQSVSTDVVIGQNSRRNAGSAQPHLMELQGKRLAYCSETQDTDSISAAQVKNISGGDPITARWLNENPVTFMPTHTLFLQTNRKPQAPPDDEALWERIKVVEFKVRFLEEPTKPDERPRDPNLEADLQREAPGILAWLVRGGIEWMECKGLKTPDSVKLARDTYRREESIEPFLEAACVELPEQSAESSLLYSAYESWCSAEGLRKKSQHWFGKQLGAKYEKGKNGANRAVYFGVGLETTDFSKPLPKPFDQKASVPTNSVVTQNNNGHIEAAEAFEVDLQSKITSKIPHESLLTRGFEGFEGFEEEKVSELFDDSEAHAISSNGVGIAGRLTGLKSTRAMLFDEYERLGGDVRLTLTLDELRAEIERLKQ